MKSRGTYDTAGVPGHGGSVRCVVVVSSVEIMSCGDDGTVRRWNTSDGTCRQACGPHTTPVLSVATLLPHGTSTSSSSEGQFVCCTAEHTLQIWRGGALRQTVTVVASPEDASPSRRLPQPVMCVLSNGDVATSSRSVAVAVRLGITGVRPASSL